MRCPTGYSRQHEGAKVKTVIVGLFISAALIAAPRVVAADPVTITGGHWVEVANIDGGGMMLISSQFNVTGPWDCGANAAGWCGSISAPAWAPGSTVDFTTQAIGHDFAAVGTLNAAPFVGSFQGTQMLFSVAPFMLPGPIPVDSMIAFSIPFSMNGLLMLTGSSTAFSNEVAGNGLLSFGLRSFQSGGGTMYQLDPLSTSFTFSSSAVAT